MLVCAPSVAPPVALLNTTENAFVGSGMASLMIGTLHALVALSPSAHDSARLVAAKSSPAAAVPFTAAQVTPTAPSVPPVRLTDSASVPTFSAIVRVAAPANESAPGVSGLIAICSVPAGTDVPSMSLQLMLTLATTAAVGVPEIKPVVGLSATFEGSVPDATA